MDFELTNFIISLVIYSFKTISVFWSSHRKFTFVFGAQLIFSSIIHLLSYLGYMALYLELETNQTVDIQRLLTPTLLTFLYLLSNSFLFISSWCVFHFGYGIVLDQMKSYLKNLGYHHKLNSHCAPYLTHVLALFSILLFVICNGPIIYDYITAYRTPAVADKKNWLLIVHLIACVLYMLFWIILWFTFTLLQQWDVNLDENFLKRYVILHNQTKYFLPAHENDNSTDQPKSSCFTSMTNKKDQTIQTGENSFSNSTASSLPGCMTPRSQSGSLNNQLQFRQKKCQDQKVKFQTATKIIIETNVDSDLDTISENSYESDEHRGHNSIDDMGPVKSRQQKLYLIPNIFEDDGVQIETKV